MPTTLTSKRHAVEGSLDDAIEFCFQQGWTDGLPVVPPTAPKVARMLDVNAGDNLFGPGWRSNLTIGRALRLVMRNVCGSRPGTLDRGTLGHPGKLSYVIAENEAESPWTPLHVERGFGPSRAR